MEIMGISSKEAVQLCAKWEKISDRKLGVETVQSFCTNDRINCMVVKQNDDVCALFEIRNAPSHIKNMTILLNPDIDMDPEGDLKVLVTRLEFVVDILANIFKHVVEAGLSSKELVKLRNDREFIRTALMMFAKNLENESEGYSVVFVKDWIHILKNETKVEAIK